GAALDELAGGRIRAQLAGGEDQPAAHDGLAVGTNGPWRCVRLDRQAWAHGCSSLRADTLSMLAGSVRSRVRTALNPVRLRRVANASARSGSSPMAKRVG